MKNSEFRSWIQKIWQENIAERQDYRDLPYSMEEYWNRYKFWLKREYKFQKIKDGQKT